MIKVTAAVVSRGDRVMLCQRPRDKMMAGLWEFPGGKLEPRETLFQCVVRECQEELCVELEPLDVVAVLRNGPYEITFIRCTLEKGEPLLTEHEDLRWVTHEEARKLRLCPTDFQALDHIFGQEQVSSHRIADLIEPDNGCEGVPPGEEPMVTLVLEDGSRLLVPDRLALDKGWDIGAYIDDNDIARYAKEDKR